MITLEVLAELFGWLSIINIGILGFTTFCMLVFNQHIANIHSKLFDLTDDQLAQAYFQYLAQYKILILMFNLSPYIALKLMQ